jgi:gas vesicle protein
MMDDNEYTAMPAFLAGALIGAGIALLLAPQTGSELRGMLRSYASKARDEAYERGREAWDTAVERGKDYVETGKETLRDAGKTARDYMETGRENLREAGREIGKEATRNRG